MRIPRSIIAVTLLAACLAGPTARGEPSIYQPSAPPSREQTELKQFSPARESTQRIKPHTPANSEKNKPNPGGLPSPMTIIGSLALVLGIFFLIIWLLRRTSLGGIGSLPADIFEVLGRAPLADRQQVHLVRCGKKLLLVAIGTASAATLTEITDSEEIDRLASLCRKPQPNGTASVLRQVFRRREDRDD